MLNHIGYDRPISIEWEDAGMDRLDGAPEAARLHPLDERHHARRRRVLRRRLRQQGVSLALAYAGLAANSADRGTCSRNLPRSSRSPAAPPPERLLNVQRSRR